MLSYDIRASDGVIVLTSVGETTLDDYQAVAPKFDADVKSHKIRKILLDCREFTGWVSEEAESQSFFSWTQNRDLFDRIALVVRDIFDYEIGRFLEFFRNAGTDVRVFPPSQHEAALEWLKEGGNTEG